MTGHREPWFASSTAARHLSDCVNCGGPIYENLVHHCGTARPFRIGAPSDYDAGCPSCDYGLPYGCTCDDSANSHSETRP